MVPDPSFNVPFHSADDVRTAILSSLSKIGLNFSYLIFAASGGWQNLPGVQACIVQLKLDENK
jgi:hypothetical protein